MKRKKTQLEINLIEKGWELDHKTYTGKHSDKVLNYVYEKVYSREFERKDGKLIVTTWSARVLLDSKREHFVDVLIKSPMSAYVNDITIAFMFGKIRDITKEVESCYPKDTNEETLSKEEVDEVVEVAEVVSGSDE